MRFNYIFLASIFLVSTAIGSKTSVFSLTLENTSESPMSAHIIQGHGKPHKTDLNFKKGENPIIAFDWGRGWHGVSGIVKITDEKRLENYCEIQYLYKHHCVVIPPHYISCIESHDNKVLTCRGNTNAKIDFPSTTHPKIIVGKYQTNF